MKIGYARVSTLDQNPDLQRDELEKAGCDKEMVDRVSGTVAERAGLAKAKELLRRGDTFVVWRLDRLGRSLSDLIKWVVISKISRRARRRAAKHPGIHRHRHAHGQAGLPPVRLPGGLRVQPHPGARAPGLAASRARGRNGGRRKALDPGTRALTVDLYRKQEMPVGKSCELMGVSEPTLYGYVREGNKTRP